jgi:phosphate starvation-inducible PhoH-like protein
MAKSERRLKEKRPTREEKVHLDFKLASPLQPLNQGQAEYIRSIESSPYIIATGYAGTSKTYIPTRMAAKWLQQEAIEKIVIARPAASMSESLGFFKGDHVEKMKMWIAPVLDALREDLKPGYIEYLITIGAIDCVPMETIKGRSMKNAFIIIDEAEDLTLKEVKALLTRLGTNSTMVFAGDISQVDIARSGLGEFLALREKNARLKNVVQHIAFDEYDDIVRSEAVKDVIIGLDEVSTP